MVFHIGHILWGLVEPANLLCLVLLAITFVVSSRRKEVFRMGQSILQFFTLFVLLLTVLPIGEWLLLPLENLVQRQLPEKADGIIVLGADEDPVATEMRGQPVMSSVHRYVAMAEAARKYPDAKLVFSGGFPGDGAARGKGNAYVAKMMIENLGLPADKVIYEDVSRTTYENAIESAKLLHPTPEQSWIVITNGVHMPRASATFRQAGFKVYSWPTNYITAGPWYFGPSFDLSGHLRQMCLALHEYVGLVAYWLLGRIPAPWPV